MRHFDLHCDTLYRAVTENRDLLSNDFHISLRHKACFDKWTQCFAVWIPDDITLFEARELLKKAVRRLNADAPQNSFEIYSGKGFDGRYTAILTVEGGRIIGDDAEYQAACRGQS